MTRTTNSILPMRVLEYWYGPQEDWGLNGMVEETWLDNPTDSRLDIYNLENYVHKEVDRDQYLENPGIYMVVKNPSYGDPTGMREASVMGFPFNNSKYAKLKTQGLNRIEVTTKPDYEVIFTPYVKPFTESFTGVHNKNDQTHFSVIKKDKRFLHIMRKAKNLAKGSGIDSAYKYYELYSYTHTTFESVLRILNWHPFPEIFID